MLIVDAHDATGRLMELCFVKAESAFDAFAATTANPRRPGKPVAFYNDNSSIFRVAAKGTSGNRGDVTQVGRALSQLSADILCANTPQVMGRIEPMNLTLQRGQAGRPTGRTRRRGSPAAAGTAPPLAAFGSATRAPSSPAASPWPAAGPPASGRGCGRSSWRPSAG